MGGQYESGRFWEAAACEYLRHRGLEVLEQRYRCRLGELDIVCRERTTLVIVEVRARSRSAYVTAIESIDWRKRRRIIQATRHLLMRHPEWNELELRFDVVAIGAIDSDAPKVDWVRNAFDCS